MARRRALIASLTALAAATTLGGPAAGGSWSFTEVAAQAGADYTHGVAADPSEAEMIAGGVAAGDVDRDGWVDLYAVRGADGPDLLLHNLGVDAGGQVRFERLEGPSLGIAPPAQGIATAPTLADVDGDGWLDLLIGGILEAPPRLFRNLGAAGGGLLFEDVTGASGLFATTGTFGSAFGDYDRDGDLDVFLSHWLGVQYSPHLWRNAGDGTFGPVDFLVGIADVWIGEVDYTFTPNFADFDDDGWPDLLVTGDFGTSQVFRNLGDAGGTVGFSVDTGPVISDENGMGAAVGDVDGDGDLDWFVSSIWDPDGSPEGNWGVTGNRLYRNDGGVFEDGTDDAGVRRGYWGWGSCFADFDLDGDLDLFHTNGFPLPMAFEFHDDPVRLFVNDGGGVFTEQAQALGLDDTAQGRGVVCFDADRDGDVDLFIANNGGPSRFYRNDLAPGRFLHITLAGTDGNTEGIGARVRVTAGGRTQMREVRAGSNFASQDPAVAHFGLGDAAVAERVEVRWLDGTVETRLGVAANQFLALAQGQVAGPPAIPALGGPGLALLLVAVGTAGLALVRRDP